MRLEDIYELYLMMLEPFEIDPKELEEFKEPPKEEIKEIPFPQVEPYPVVQELKEGDVIEIAPSDDGLPLLFVVGEINDKAGEATLFPLSQFVELATPWDALVHVEGKPYIAQTDLFVTAPADGKIFSTLFPDKTPLLIGSIKPEELEEVKAVYRREKGGIGGMAGGVKAKFKEKEAERYARLQLQILREMEKLDRAQRILEELKTAKLATAAAQKVTSGSTDAYGWYYDEKREHLILFPKPPYVGIWGRIVLRFGPKEVVLHEGVIRPKMEFYLPARLFPGKEITQLLKLERLP